MLRESNGSPTAPPNNHETERIGSAADQKLGDLADDGCGRLS
jgi:hypothetical protein